MRETMTTPLQNNLELREWQKKFNPAHPVKAITPAVKRPANDKNNNKYLQSLQYSKIQ